MRIVKVTKEKVTHEYHSFDDFPEGVDLENKDEKWANAKNETYQKINNTELDSVWKPNFQRFWLFESSYIYRLRRSTF